MASSDSLRPFTKVTDMAVTESLPAYNINENALFSRYLTLKNLTLCQFCFVDLLILDCSFPSLSFSSTVPSLLPLGWIKVNLSDFVLFSFFFPCPKRWDVEEKSQNSSVIAVGFISLETDNKEILGSFFIIVVHLTFLEDAMQFM